MADLDIKVQLRAFDKMSKQFATIKAAGSKLAKQFENSRAQLSKLNAQLKDISAYRAQRAALDKSATALTAMREKMRSLHNQLKNNSGSERTRKQTEALRRQYDAARASVSKLEEKHRSYQSKLKTVADRLRSAGISTRNLNTHETALKQKADTLNNSLKTQAVRLDKVRAAQQRLNNASQRYANTMSKVRSAQMAGGIAIAKGTGAAYGMARLVAPGVNFDKEIDRTAAIARVAKGSDDYNMLREQAKQLGATTAFSASQVAQGQQFLAMAGFTPDAIHAAMQDMLNLAAVGDMELKDTADISSNILSAFKLAPEEMGRVADVMSATITRTNTDIRMLGDSMKYVAPAAQSVGASIEETAAMIGLLGNIGIQGEQSGAALRNLYNRLSSPPKAAQDALDALGISAVDAQGNLRELPTILAEVAEATKDMGSATRLGYFSDIAGLRAGTALSELVDQAGIGQITQFRDVLEDVEGISQRTASAMLDNSYGDWVNLKSAVEGFSVAITEANGGALRKLIQSVTEMVRNITAWVEKNPKLAATIAKVTTTLTILMIIGGAFLLILTSIIGPLVALQYGLVAVGAIASVISAPVLGVIAIVAALAASAYWVYNNWDNISGFFKERLDAVRNWFSTTFELLRTDTVAGLIRISKAILNWSPVGLFYKAFANVMNYFGVELPDSFTKFIAGIWDAIVAGIKAWDPLPYIKEAFAGVVDWFTNYLPNLIKNSVSNALTSVKDAAVSIGSGIANGVKAGAGKVKDGASALAKGTVNTFKNVLGINSPSRVFMQLAEFIPDGIAVGLSNNKRAPIATMQGIAKKLTGVGLGMAMTATPMLASAAITPVNTAASMNNKAQYTININVAGGTNTDSAQTIAQAVRHEIERIEREREARARSRIYD